jgi:hypothetical protein
MDILSGVLGSKSITIVEDFGFSLICLILYLMTSLGLNSLFVSSNTDESHVLKFGVACTKMLSPT